MWAQLGKQLTSLDAFPKVDVSYRKQTTSGGIATLLVVIVLSILTLSEVLEYLKIEQDYEFMVDTTANDDNHNLLEINLDITFAMPCNYINVDVQDVSGDSIHAKHQLTMQQTVFDAELFSSHRLQLQSIFGGLNIRNMILDARRQRAEENGQAITGGNGCRIFGQMDVKKVAGNLHFTAVGHGHFGEHAPHEAFEMFQYFVSIVPTIYVDRWDNGLITSQYAVTEHRRVIEHETGAHGVPGVFFRYDLESILVRITERKKSFLHFLVRVSGIVGGIVATTGMFHQFSLFLTKLSSDFIAPMLVAKPSL